MTKFVTLRNIVKNYGQLRALDDVSFDIGSGVTGLLGPNGAGKTTLIKVLLGLVQFNSGEGQVLGHDLAPRPTAIREGVGYMPEDDCYIAGLSGIRMLQFSARLAGLPSTEALRRSHEILDFCGLQQERYRQVDTYSTGMRQKLKFGQAIVHNPPFLILDEPTSGLDPEERQAMLNRIKILATEFKKGVLVSTHILPDVQSVCDQVIILARGAVQVVSPLEDLSRPAFPSYQVRVMGDAERFAKRVRDAGFQTADGEDGGITITGGDGNVASKVFQWSRELGVSIRSLRPARNSLEQIFLDAVQGNHRADS